MIVEATMIRRAACSCGQLRLTIEGEPSRIAMCHCLECQRRTGADAVRGSGPIQKHALPRVERHRFP